MARREGTSDEHAQKRADLAQITDELMAERRKALKAGDIVKASACVVAIAEAHGLLRPK